MKFQTISGPELAPFLAALGQLRIQVFREFPYLYDGDLEYEKKYLSRYLQTSESQIQLLFYGDSLVGASTAILAKHEDWAFQNPLRAAGYAPEKVCYFGESLLLPAYRGQGWGKKFMEGRLQFAESFSFIQWAAFCAVIRPSAHPLRPKDYKPLDPFWQSMGFAPKPGLIAKLDWLDISDKKESTKDMQYWLKKLR
jgi:GNAT superfamily N-acetyltransferase